MFVNNNNALADSTPLSINYVKYYLEQIAITASQMVPTMHYLHYIVHYMIYVDTRVTILSLIVSKIARITWKMATTTAHA